jgi:hypothetical protein
MKIKMLKDTVVAPKGTVFEAKLSPEWCWSFGLGYHVKDWMDDWRVVHFYEAQVIETNRYDVCPKCQQMSLQFALDGTYVNCCNVDCDYGMEGK